ncbi:TPA: RHS repeat-associated core domain-containing protein [Stenotrophomonas maltophilia]
MKLAGVRSQQFWHDARNQLTNVRDDAGATLTGLAWDVQGNLSLRNGRKYDFDFDFDFGNRLREVQEAERYAYDAYGRRAVAYDAQGQRLRAMYSLAGQVVHEERRGKGASEYIHVGGRLLATRSPTGVTWVHVDALGSPVAVTDNTGSVVERRRFEPYGAELGGQVKDGPGYTGHVSDSATGLVYMQQRYMDPQLGVFLSVDPATAYEQPVGQFNRYRYANGNPYKFTDPDGRAVTCDERRCSGEVNTIADALALPVILTVAYGGRLLSNVIDSVHRNETADPSNSAAGSGDAKPPALPTDLVGDQSSPLAGPNKNGTRHTSGNLKPDFGGTGNYDSDLKALAGDTRPAVRGDSAPPGAQIGENGVSGRQTNSSGGKSIDIPANGDKPHETLHYD